MHKNTQLLCSRPEHRKTGEFYVSEFESFINRFLGEHPEVVEDQSRGMSIHWDKKIDFSDLDKAQQDAVPDNRYGFYCFPGSCRGR